MVISFEYSKDFSFWVDTIGGEDITRHTITGSYDVRQGYNLSETPRASTFSMDVVMDFALSKALLEYPYIRVKKDGVITFIGQLEPESVRKIETLTQEVLSIKYVHMLSILTEKTFGNKDFKLDYIEADGIKVLDNDDPTHSLTHILINDYILNGEAIPFTFNNEYAMKVNVIHFSATGKEKVWDVLNQLLREYGFILRIDNLSITVVDILKDGVSGVELLDGADISVKTSDEDLSLPKVKYQETYIDRDVTLYHERYDIGGFLWWGKYLEGDLPLTFEEGDGKEMVAVTNIRYDAQSAEVTVEEAYINEGLRTFHRKLHLAFGTLSHIGTESLKADVTYAIYKESIAPDQMPEGFSVGTDTLEPKYLYGADQVKRYLLSLARIKQFKKTEWTFYSKVKLNVDDIVRFKDIPDSTCRIFEVQDTLEMDGGYTYRAFPFDAHNITFVQKEEYVEPSFGNEIQAIYPAEPIFIENETYKKPSWRIYIQTKNTYKTPTVTVNDVPYEVKYDGRVTRYYVDVTLTDVGYEYITVKASVDFSEEEVHVPIYRADNRPVIIEYRYSSSSADPNFDDRRIVYGNYAVRYGKYGIGWNGEQWTQRVPSGSRYDDMFLWKRTWNYNIEEWVYELLTPVTKEFEIFASSSIYPISKRNMIGTEITIKVVSKGYPMQDVQVFSNAEGGVLTKMPTSGQWSLLLPATISQDSVRIWAKVGDISAETFLTGVISDDLPIYWGKLDVAPDASEVNLVEGDYYLAMDNIPWRWNGNDWKVLEAIDSNYSNIVNNVMADAFSDESQVIPSQSVIWQYVRNLMANDATVENLVARNLKVEDELKKFVTHIKGEDTTPAIFDVQYDRGKGDGLQTIFKIVPENGNIFMGRPNTDATAPESGFMYNAQDETMVSKDNNFVIESSGDVFGNFKQVTQFLPYTFNDSLDGDHPALFDMYVPNGILEDVIILIRSQKYRTYNSTITDTELNFRQISLLVSGTTNGGAASLTSGQFQGSGTISGNIYANVSGNITSGSVNLPSSTVTGSATGNILGNKHTHTLSLGIIEDTEASDMTFTFDNTGSGDYFQSITNVTSGVEINKANYASLNNMTSGGWKALKVTSNSRGRVQMQVILKMRIDTN